MPGWAVEDAVSVFGGLREGPTLGIEAHPLEPAAPAAIRSDRSGVCLNSRCRRSLAGRPRVFVERGTPNVPVGPKMQGCRDAKDDWGN